MIRRLVLCAVLVAATAALARSQPSGDALDPLRVAPDTHKLAFENAFLRVLEVHVPPGKVEPRHRHPRGLSVYLADQDVRITVDGRAPEVTHRKKGTVAWSDPIVHTVENIGKTEMFVFRIELK